MNDIFHTPMRNKEKLAKTTWIPRNSLRGGKAGARLKEKKYGKGNGISENSGKNEFF